MRRCPVRGRRSPPVNPGQRCGQSGAAKDPPTATGWSGHSVAIATPTSAGVTSRRPVINSLQAPGFRLPLRRDLRRHRSAWDYGPLGVELKENIKRSGGARWSSRDDIVGLDSSVILPPQVWEASATSAFHRPADRVPVLPQAVPRRPPAGGVRGEEGPRPRRPGRRSPARTAAPAARGPSRGRSTAAQDLPRPVEDESGLHYLRPETAQGIFVNFANVMTPRARSRRSASARSASRSATRSRPGHREFQVLLTYPTIPYMYIKKTTLFPNTQISTIRPYRKNFPITIIQKKMLHKNKTLLAFVKIITPNLPNPPSPIIHNPPQSPLQLQ
jgi:hypothetical protein